MKILLRSYDTYAYKIQVRGMETRFLATYGSAYLPTSSHNACVIEHCIVPVNFCPPFLRFY